MVITDATWTDADHQCIRAIVDGKLVLIPPYAGNRHYDEILKQNIMISDES